MRTISCTYNPRKYQSDSDNIVASYIEKFQKQSLKEQAQTISQMLKSDQGLSVMFAQNSQYSNYLMQSAHSLNPSIFGG